MAKAWQVEGLEPDAPLGDCARRILETRFREVMHYRRGTIAGREIEQLHSMRVSTRRLRSAMKNFGKCFDRAGLRFHNAQIREIADTLGAVRDLDVRIAWLKGVRDAAPIDEHPGIDLLIGRARRARTHARRPMIELLRRLEREGYEQTFLEFLSRAKGQQGAGVAKTRKVPGIDCSETFAATARRVIPARATEVYDHVPALDDSSDSVGLHDLRISIKRLRYSLEFFVVCFDQAEVEGLLAPLAEIQDLLGDVHDADVLVPELQLALGGIEEDWAAQVRRSAAPAAKTGEASFKDMIGSAARAPEELGLLGLLHRMRQQRSTAYRRAHKLWRRLEAEGLRERLERLVGTAHAAAGGQ